jgi:signal transduction histidine kinase
MKPGRALRASILAVGAALIACFVGSAAWDSWRLNRQVVSGNDRELRNLANALAEELSRSLQSVDLLLGDTAVWYEGNAGRPPQAIEAVLAMRAGVGPQGVTLTIADAQGRERYRSHDSGAPLGEIGGQPYFGIQRAKSVPALFVNQTLLLRDAPEPGLVLSRRLNGPGGRFDGVIYATVTCAQLQAAYSAIDLGPGSALLLTSGDGTLVVRQPRIVGITGNSRIPELVGVRKGAAVDRFTSPMDGRIKLVSAAAVGRESLILAITRDEEEALRPWRDEVRSAIVRTGIISLLIALTIAGLLRQLRRAEQAEAGRARLEARLQQARRLEALGTLAGGIAHDFNNILGAILGFGEMAQARAEPGSALRRYVDQMMQSGARARLLVKKILDFSRAGVAERAPVHLQGVVEEVVAMLMPSLPAGVRIATRLEAGDAAVVGDPTELHQVAMNLCTNAVRAIAGEGEVGVSLSRRTLAAPRSLQQGDLAAGEHACLVVSDTGEGMDAAALARIFEPFFTTRKPGEGTGLGLSVVHGIVADLGGAIDVESAPGRGTRVTVWLPVAGEVGRPPAAPAVAAEASWPEGRGQTVMIVDDERALVDLAEELLAGLGYEPVGFDSAEAALRAFEADPGRFDAVLTDEAMPGLRGRELAARVLALRPGLPVLLMSGNLGDADERAALAAGLRAVLRKPLALRELAEGLAAVLR